MPRFDYHNLTPTQQEQRIRSSRAKADMDRDRLSLSQAAARQELTAGAVLRWFPGSIVRDGRGPYRAILDDEVFRMVVATTDGVLELDVRGSDDRSTVGTHMSAIFQLLDHGDPGPLLEMRGTVVGGYALETDPREIEALAIFGELDFLEIYLTDGSEDEQGIGS